MLVQGVDSKQTPVSHFVPFLDTAGVIEHSSLWERSNIII